MQARQNISAVLTIALFIATALGSVLHEFGGSHSCHSHQVASQGHDHANCIFPHSHDTAGKASPDTPVPSRQCEDDCAICVLLSQSFQVAAPPIITGSEDVVEPAIYVTPGIFPAEPCGLPTTRGPPVV